MPATKTKPRCLCIYGSDLGYETQPGSVRPRSHGTSSLHHQIDRDLFDVTQLILCPLENDQVLDLRLGPYDVVLNSISDSDVNPVTLAMAEEVCDASGLPVFNHPRAILGATREGISALLKDVPELLVPRTVRIKGASRDSVLRDIAAADITWPVLFRPAGSHTGLGLERFVSLEDAEDHIFGAVPSPESLMSDHYLTEFVDFCSPDGLYRKVRIYCLGGRPCFRHHMVGKSWNVHTSSRIDKDDGNEYLMKEGWDFFAAFEETLGVNLANSLSQMNDRTGLQYVGLDASLMEDGRLLIFEVNPNMDIRMGEPGNPAAELNEASRMPIRAQLNEILMALAS